jgi:outer membrane protein OmpA-like peptidoglycan-associated protein
MRLFALLGGLLLCGCTALAQKPFVLKDAPKKAQEQYKEATELLRSQQTDKAIKQLEKLIKQQPNFLNAYWVLGDAYRSKNELDKALQTFEQAAKLAPEQEPKVYAAMGSLCMEKKDYPCAQGHFERFLAFPNLNPELQAKIQRQLGDARFRPQALAKPQPFVPKNLGDNINSPQREYFPSVTAESNVLVFTVQEGTGQRAQEDLYYAEKKEGQWQPRKPIPGVNTAENEAAQTISADGKLLVFTVCNRPGDFGSCDLYFSRLVNGQWTKPQNMGEPINSPNWESQPSLSPHGDALYFTRGGARGQGTKDIYVSYFDRQKGQWKNPEPLSLNTPYNESAPCLHPDGQTLYFASDGYPGMGGTDLFLSRRKADGSWGEVLNLGYPINTEGMEEALAVSFDGQLAYLAAERSEGKGSLDIYEFELPNALRPQPITYAKILVVDAQTGQNLQAQLKVSALESERVFLESSTNRDGSFLVCLPLGQRYGLHAWREGYLFHSESFALQEGELAKPSMIKIALQPIPKIVDKPSGKKDTLLSKPIILKNVFFETASAALLPSSKTELNDLAALLKSQPKLKIQLNGHTDSEGEEAANLDLSQRRAEAVRQYLIQSGIQADRLRAQGYGESKPIASNDTPDGRRQNRRTEFVVIE